VIRDANIYRGGAEATKDLPKILSHPVFQKHVAFDGDLKDVLGAGAVEVRFLYFSSEISDAEKEKVGTSVRQKVDEKFGACADVAAVRVGWSLENDFPILRDGEPSGRVGTVLGIFVGWSTAGAQKKFRREHGDTDEIEKFGETDRASESLTALVECRQFGKSRE
jgi:hypothetical protein